MPKVSALPVATSLATSDVLLVVQGGVTKQITKETLENSLMTAPLTLLIDEIDASVSYAGKAAPGSATSGAVWQIKRITLTGPDIAIQYAGNGLFDQVWDNRLSLTYTN